MQVELLLESFIELLRISIAGIPIAIGVYLFMEAFKQSGIVESDFAKRIAPLLIAIVLGGIFTSIELVEASEITYKFVVERAYQSMLGALFAGLFYTKIVKSIRGDNKKEVTEEEVFDIEE